MVFLAMTVVESWWCWEGCATWCSGGPPSGAWRRELRAALPGTCAPGSPLDLCPRRVSAGASGRDDIAYVCQRAAMFCVKEAAHGSNDSTRAAGKRS